MVQKDVGVNVCVLIMNLPSRGVEHLYKKHFGKDGITTRVGYTGGDVNDPTYRQVRHNHWMFTKYSMGVSFYQGLLWEYKSCRSIGSDI